MVQWYLWLFCHCWQWCACNFGLPTELKRRFNILTRLPAYLPQLCSLDHRLLLMVWIPQYCQLPRFERPSFLCLTMVPMLCVVLVSCFQPSVQEVLRVRTHSQSWPFPSPTPNARRPTMSIFLHVRLQRRYWVSIFFSCHSPPLP